MSYEVIIKRKQSAVGRQVTTRRSAAGEASELFKHGKRAEAIEHLKKELEKDPQNIRNLSQIGRYLVICRREVEAIPCLEQAIALRRTSDRISQPNPELITDMTKLLGVYSRMGKYPEALMLLEFATKRFPNDGVFQDETTRIRNTMESRQTIARPSYQR